MTTKLKWIFSTFLLVLLGTLLGLAPTAQAANTGADFTIKPVYPSNQVDGALGYFRLKVHPDQAGSIGLKIENYGAVDQNLTITPTKATTNDVGQIDYTPAKRKLDRSAQYNLPQLLSEKQTITVPAKTTKTVTFTYKIPQKGFKGTLLGGFYVYSNTRETGKSSNVINHYAMVLGISMSQNAPHRLAPQLKMGVSQNQ